MWERAVRGVEREDVWLGASCVGGAGGQHLWPVSVRFILQRRSVLPFVNMPLVRQ